MDPVAFEGTVRYWNPETSSGLVVLDIPSERIAALGGLRQQRVRGTIGGAAFTSNVMPARGGRLALTVSKAMLGAACLAIGDTASVVIARLGRDE